MPWVRLWVDIFDSEKIADLDDSTYRGWTLVLLAAKKHDENGLLPPVKRMAHWARRPISTIERWITDLISAGFIDMEDDEYRVHDWDYWQPPKDQTNAQRQARHKAKKKCPPAPPKEERETDTETEAPVTQPPLPRNSNGPVTALPAPNAVDADRVCNLAAELAGDISWALWCSRRIQMGDSPAVMEAALKAAVDAGVMNQQYVGKIAARYSKEGIPKLTTFRGKAAKESPYPTLPYTPPVARDPGPKLDPAKVREALGIRQKGAS